MTEQNSLPFEKHDRFSLGIFVNHPDTQEMSTKIIGTFLHLLYPPEAVIEPVTLAAEIKNERQKIIADAKRLPDTLTMQLYMDPTMLQSLPSETREEWAKFLNLTMHIPVTFFPIQSTVDGTKALACILFGETLYIAIPPGIDPATIEARNARFGLAWPSHTEEKDQGKQQPAIPPFDQTDTYKVHTGQEMDAWQMAAADGRTCSHWNIDPQTGEARHTRPNSPFMTLILDRKDLDPVDVLIQRQDVNTGLAALYILGVMEIAKYGPLPGGATYTARIDLLDVAKKSGMITRQGKHDREQARARVWGLLQFGARAEIKGVRSTPYYLDGKEIPTKLSGTSLWSLQSIEYPDERGHDEQRKLFPLDDVPLRVRVTLNKDWEPFLFGANLPQYLRFGEKIGAIPAGKPSGAWAQAMSLAYLHWARVILKNYRQKVLTGEESPTRRELLTKYPPAVCGMEEVSSNGRNQRRIVETYLQALEIMAEEGIIARAGDVLTTADQQLKGFPRKNWLDPWLNALAKIIPGADIRQSIETEILSSYPLERPRVLQKTNQRARSRKRPSKEEEA